MIFVVGSFLLFVLCDPCMSQSYFFAQTVKINVYSYFMLGAFHYYCSILFHNSMFEYIKKNDWLTNSFRVVQKSGPIFLEYDLIFCEKYCCWKYVF